MDVLKLEIIPGFTLLLQKVCPWPLAYNVYNEDIGVLPAPRKFNCCRSAVVTFAFVGNAGILTLLLIFALRFTPLFKTKGSI